MTRSFRTKPFTSSRCLISISRAATRSCPISDRFCSDQAGFRIAKADGRAHGLEIDLRRCLIEALCPARFRGREGAGSPSQASRNPAGSPSRSAGTDRAAPDPARLQRIVGRPLLLQIAVDRAARFLEEIVRVPRRTKFQEEAAQHSRCEGLAWFISCSDERIPFDTVGSIFAPSPRCVNTYIPPSEPPLLAGRGSNRCATSDRSIA